MIPFEQCESHPGRVLREHILSVASLMEQQAIGWKPGVADWFPRLARLVGILHDTGKATIYFQQERLRRLESRPNQLGDHAHFSALISVPILNSACHKWGYDERESDLIFAAALMTILRHHGSLTDFGDYITTFVGRVKHDSNSVFEKQFASIDVLGLRVLLNQELDALGLPSTSLGRPSESDLRPLRKLGRRLNKRECLADFFTAELLFALLVWADKIDAATAGAVPSRHLFTIPADIVDQFKVKAFGPPSTAEEKLRDDIYREVEQTLFDATNAGERLFTLTAPTGSGKTLSVVNAAVKLREKLTAARGTVPRIIYCLPFTSIIDQNFDVIRDVLQASGVAVTSDVLIKHHHLVGPEYTDHENRDYAYNVGQLLIESWDSEIIVTTFIQLLESLIGNRNSMLRKATRIPGSIFLLDEVQTIPRKYWETVRDTLVQFSERFDSRFVLLTATKPLIFEPDEATELLPSHRTVFGSFDRYDIHIKSQEPTTLQEFQSAFVGTITSHRDARHMAVMNTVESSIEVFKTIRERRKNDFRDFPKGQLFYLSTNITPRDRRRRIQAIKDSSDPLIVVSTQVIEAGVDISVDFLHRDFAPLDSIVQAAGRCNRSNERPTRGTVFLWNLVADVDTRRAYSRIYDSVLRDITKIVIDGWGVDPIPERAVLSLAEDYFREAKRRLADAEVQHHMKHLDFAKVAEAFKLIEDYPKQSYFVRRSNDQIRFRSGKCLFRFPILMTLRNGVRSSDQSSPSSLNG